MRATSFNTYSDATLKSDVQDIDLSSIFDAFFCESYNRTDKPELGRRVGFLAQDVQSACVSAGVPDTFTSSIQQEDGSSLLAMDYERLCCVLWSKVKQLEARLRTIEQAIENA